MASAREDGAWVYDDATLDENGFEWAWGWLKKLYEDKYMTASGLAQAQA
jgi:hypothetical protein